MPVTPVRARYTSLAPVKVQPSTLASERSHVWSDAPVKLERASSAFWRSTVCSSAREKSDSHTFAPVNLVSTSLAPTKLARGIVEEEKSAPSRTQ